MKHRRLQSAALAFLASAALASAPNVSSAQDHDAGIGLINQFQVPLGERLSIHGMLQNRWTEDVDTYERTLVRPWISYALEDGGHVTADYHFHEFESPDRHGG